MSTHSGPNIVEDGLVLSLDPANQKSYSPNMFPYSTDIFSWTQTAGVNNGTQSRDTSTASPIGNSPVKLVVSGNDSHFGTYNSGAWNFASAKNGETWTVSVYVKATIATTCQIFIFGANSAGTGYIGGSWLAITAQTHNVSTEWTRVSTKITMANADIANIQFRLDGPDSYVSPVTLWFDGVQVEKSSSATPFNPNYYGNIINDLSGNGNNGTIYGDFTFNGNTKVLHSNGVTGSYIDIPSPNLTSSNFTVISATRYAGSSPRGRIISARFNNWLLGHWSSQAEKYFSNGWVTSSGGGPNDELWRIHAGTGNISSDQYSFWSNKDKLVSNSVGGSSGPNGFRLGSSSGGTAELSNCDISFLLAYNRILSDQEIEQNFNALRSRYGI